MSNLQGPAPASDFSRFAMKYRTMVWFDLTMKNENGELSDERNVRGPYMCIMDSLTIDCKTGAWTMVLSPPPAELVTDDAAEDDPDNGPAPYETQWVRRNRMSARRSVHDPHHEAIHVSNGLIYDTWTRSEQFRNWYRDQAQDVMEHYNDFLAEYRRDIKSKYDNCK